jgi:hypothetical protein
MFPRAFPGIEIHREKLARHIKEMVAGSPPKRLVVSGAGFPAASHPESPRERGGYRK